MRMTFISCINSSSIRPTQLYSSAFLLCINVCDLYCLGNVELLNLHLFLKLLLSLKIENTAFTKNTVFATNIQQIFCTKRIAEQTNQYPSSSGVNTETNTNTQNIFFHPSFFRIWIVCLSC